jgi:hypothetical protein
MRFTFSRLRESGTGCWNEATSAFWTSARNVLPDQPKIAVRSSVASISSSPFTGELARSSIRVPAGNAKPSAHGSNQTCSGRSLGA